MCTDMEYINWGDGYYCGKGITPSVAMNDHGIIVEAHHGDGLTSKVWYQVGVRAVGNTIEWGDSIKYDTGKGPRIAINNNGVVVEVHQADILHDIWYNVGTVDVKTKTISWGIAQKYDHGTAPDIAINDRGTVVEVHHAGIGDLWYHAGSVDPDNKTINFGKSVRYDKGDHPAIALNNKGEVVEVHETKIGSSLWYNVGGVKDTAISFSGKAKYYSDGRNPLITIDDLSNLVEVHKSQGFNTLWFHQGGITDSESIDFGLSHPYANGTSPAVTCNSKQQLVEVHVQSLNDRWYHSTNLVKQNLTGNLSWMSDNYDVLRTKYLSQITLPGTHDTGTYDLTDIPAKGAVHPIPEYLLRKKFPFVLTTFQDFSITQHRDVGDQLKGGIRFLDLRVIKYESDFYNYHGVLGPKLSLIFDDIRRFLSKDEVTHELLIVAASNFSQMDDDSHVQFMALIMKTLGKFLYQNAGSFKSLCQTTPLQDIVGQGPKVIFIYDDKYLDTHPNANFFPKKLVYSHWSNTTSMDELISDQVKQLKEHSGVPDHLFELQWLLTTQVANGVENVVDQMNVATTYKSTLHSLSQTPGMWLSAFLNDNTQYQINIVIVDFFEETDVIQQCIKRNGV